MLTQTKQAVDALLEAGLNRNEFSVQAARRRIGYNPDTGKQMYEYGEAKIVLFCSFERVIELTPMILEQGITMTYILWQDKEGCFRIGFPKLKDDGRGRLMLWDTTRTDINQLGEIFEVRDIASITARATTG